MEPRQIIKGLLKLQNNYAFTYRTMITRERFSYAVQGSDGIDVEAKNFREPLIEHVGHLPIIASFLHPHLEHRKEVDLGRVLIMLSIHDIGETIVGDVMAYKKNVAHAEKEHEEALKLLTPDLIAYYEEFEAGESWDAKFAHSVDAAAPFLHEIIMPNLTRKRFAVHDFNSEKIEKKKRPMFVWDSVLADIFEIVLDTYHKIERNEPTGLDTNFDLK